MKQWVRKWLERTLWRPQKETVRRLDALEREFESLRMGMARLENRQLASLNSGRLQDNEFQAFSQSGQDGIIQFLLRHLRIPRPFFVEIGTQTYREANTRFLLMNNRWSGLLLEADPRAVDVIRQDPVFWQFQLQAVPAFVTKENINALLSTHGAGGDIGLLSIDVDGNDYWIWEALTVSQPAIVIVEYNSRFGKDRRVTVPYQADFDRHRAHPSGIYYGASLRALAELGRRKGYAFVGCNTLGNDAFFVRRDLMAGSPLREMSVDDGFVSCSCRESRHPDGSLAFLTPAEEKNLLESLPLVEIPPS